MPDRTTTTLLRLAPLAVVVVAIVWVGAIGFRVGWWSTGRIEAGWDDLMGSAGTPPLRLVAQVLAIVGTGAPALIEAAVLVLVVLVRRGAYWAVAVALICGIGSLHVSVLKAVAGRVRPDGAYGFQNAFPSGHTAFAALLTTLVAVLLLHGRRRALAAPYPVVMAWSRTQLHAHWLSDVLAGALLGASTAVLLVLPAEVLRRSRAPVATVRRARHERGGGSAGSHGAWPPPARLTE